MQTIRRGPTGYSLSQSGRRRDRFADAGQNTVMRIGNNGNYDQYIHFNGGNDWCAGMDYSDSNKFKISGHSSFDGTDEFFTITTSGNVGIGTSNPFCALTNTNTNPTGGTLSTDSMCWAINQGTYIATFNNEHASGSGLRIQTNGGSSVYPLAIYDDSLSDWVMVARGDGRVGIGTGSPTANLYVKGVTGGTYASIIQNMDTSGGANQIRFLDGSGDICGAITSDATNNTTAYATSSDYRLKENEVFISDGLERLNKLKPYRFNFISNPAKIKVDGFFAHEVSDIVPEAITGEKDAMKEEEYEVSPAEYDEDGNITKEAVMGTREVPDYQGIDQSKLVPLLVAAVQELSAKVEALENA